MLKIVFLMFQTSFQDGLYPVLADVFLYVSSCHVSYYNVKWYLNYHLTFEEREIDIDSEYYTHWT